MIHEEKLHSLRFSARVPARAIDLLISLAHYFMNKNRQVQQKVSCFPLLSAISIHPPTSTQDVLATRNSLTPRAERRAARWPSFFAHKQRGNNAQKQNTSLCVLSTDRKPPIEIIKTLPLLPRPLPCIVCFKCIKLSIPCARVK
jgi:hypothetical protein